MNSNAPQDPTAQRPLATIVICTRDRDWSLRRTLESIERAGQHAERPWEILILDNGSSDNTQSVVAEFSDRLPIRSVIHEIPGLSNARNAAIDHVRGEFLLWTDDDVLVDESWLKAYLDAFAETPDVALYGGRAVPHYEPPAVPWFAAAQAHLSSLLAIRDYPEWDEMTFDELPFGLNYAVRMDVQTKYRYDPDLGVAPGRRIGGEETSMLRDAMQNGAKGRWVWGATVYHLIPPARQTTDYIMSYYKSQGYLYHHVDDLDGMGALARLGVLAKITSKRSRLFFKATQRRIRGNPHWVAAYAEYARVSGRQSRVWETFTS